jgi:small subunit ribosomal protein S14
MAKKSWLARDKKKAETAKKFAAKRAELKAKGDYAALSQLPRNASPVRVVNRCKISGRRHAFIRKFGVSRLTFRELALTGQIPGVIKASW